MTLFWSPDGWCVDLREHRTYPIYGEWDWVARTDNTDLEGAISLDPPREPLKYGDAITRLRHADPEAWAVIAKQLSLSDARAELLRDHYRLVPGRPGSSYRPCEDPQKYGTDCGRCMRCRSIYTDGPLRLGKET